MTATESEPLWTRAFVLLCAVQFLGYAQHFVLQPTIPIYVTHLGASPLVVGLVMASFAATLNLPGLIVTFKNWSNLK
jgi:hypothetical protein